MLSKFRSHARQDALPLCLLAVVFFLGLFLRLEAVSSSMVEDPVRGDARSYFFYAVNLKEEGVYSRAKPRIFDGREIRPDAAINPGFPLFIVPFLGEEWRQGTTSGVYASIMPVIDVQTLLGSLTILLVYLVGRLALGAWTGVAAATLTAISPHLVNINIYFLTEPLFILVFWCAMLLLAQAAVRSDSRSLLVLWGGLAMGLATMVRPTVQYLPFLLAALALLAAPRDWRRPACFIGAFLLLPTLWAVRNLAATGAASDPFGMIATIQVGAYPGFMFNGMPESLGIPYHFDPVLTDYTSLQRTLAVVAERARAAPGEYLHWYLVGKPLALFSWETTPIGSDLPKDLLIAGDIYQYPTPVSPYASRPLFIATYLISKLLYVPCLVLAALGAVLAWIPSLHAGRGQGLMVMRLLSLTLAYVIGIHMIGSPFPRYAIPFQPILYLLALGTIATLWAWWRARTEGKPMTIEGGGTVL